MELLRKGNQELCCKPPNTQQSVFRIISVAQVMMCDFLKAVIVMLFGKLQKCVNAYCGLTAVQIGLDFI